MYGNNNCKALLMLLVMELTILMQNCSSYKNTNTNASSVDKQKPC